MAEKRQHPGRREASDEEESPEVPDRRADDTRSLAEPQKRQHPGRRAAPGHASQSPAALLGQLWKRQHPGKRYLVLPSKRQHPGKRDGGWDAAEEGDEDLAEVEKRQHPGKRVWDRSNPDLGMRSPCDVSDPMSCSKASLLLDFLDSISTGQAEEKRQHPGKRLAPEEDFLDGE